MTVYVVQNQKFVDAQTGALKDKFDFTPATTFGDLEYLLSPSARPFNLAPVLAELHEKLQNFGPDDYLLLTGNPVLLGLAVAIAADYNDGNVKLLQWSGARKTYFPVIAEDIFAAENGEADEAAA